MAPSNYILRLNLSNLELLEKVRVASSDATTFNCLAKGQNKEDCHNFVLVLIANGSEVLTCGTNSFSPECQWRKIDGLSTVVRKVSGVGKCPYTPDQNFTLIMTSDQNFYGATVTDMAGRDPAIYRMMGSSKHLRTNQYNSRWLNEPDFVSSYEIGPYVYFFFRETAIEHINCGKIIYSRVARICKDDQGGNVLLQDNWTTFSKARLNCSIPGAYPFHFDELQSTFVDREKELMYGVFTAPPTGILGTAVCVFNSTSVQRAFQGPFKYQADSNSAWIRTANKLPHYQCQHDQTKETPSSSSSSPLGEPTHSTHVLLETSKYQLMDRSVQSRDDQPVVIVEDERYTHIVKDEVRLSRGNLSTAILFLASLSGHIDKMALVSEAAWREDDGRAGSRQDGGAHGLVTCLVERIAMPCSGGSVGGKVTFMEMMSRSKDDHEEKFLMVGTLEGFYKIPVQRCFRFRKRIQCHNSQDPYCGWDDTKNICAPIGHQGLTSCPILNASVDGKFCSWSPWRPCLHVSQSNSSSARDVNDARCSCRTRECACPRTGGGGRECQGHKVEVSNCKYYKSRRHHSGLHWSPWSDWSPCGPARCGQGHQTRSRACMPAGQGHCQGNGVEWRSCRMGFCRDVRTEWSAWRVTNRSEKSWTEERRRCACTTHTPGGHHSGVAQPVMEVSTRRCDPEHGNCSSEDAGSEHRGIPKDWNSCSLTCLWNRLQKRICSQGDARCSDDNRLLEGATPRCIRPVPCDGSVRPCRQTVTVHCDVSCPTGKRIRVKICLPEDQVQSRPSNETAIGLHHGCLGNAAEEMMCLYCRDDVDYSVDDDPELEPDYDESSDYQPRSAENRDFDSTPEFGQPSAAAIIRYYHLIVVGIICFLLGGIVTVVFLSHCKPALLFGVRYSSTPTEVESVERCEVLIAFPPGGSKAAAGGRPAKPKENFADEAGQMAAINSSRTPLIDMKGSWSRSKN